MIFDTHAHYDDTSFDSDREELLSSLPAHGIGAVVTVGADLASAGRTVELMERYPFLFGAAGVHPESAHELDEEGFSWLSDLIRARKWIEDETSFRGIIPVDNSMEEPQRSSFPNTGLNKLVAVGEIGLDYYWDTDKKEQQKYWFRRQIELAVQEGLPVIIHSRDAAQDTAEMLREIKKEAEQKKQELTGVIHCFSYGVEMAEEFLSMGFYLGIGGVVTFKNAKKLLAVVEKAPLNRLLLETDCPYLAPVPNRGKRNSSLNLPYVAEKIAELKGISTEEVISATEKNARSLFRISMELL